MPVVFGGTGWWRSISHLFTRVDGTVSHVDKSRVIALQLPPLVLREVGFRIIAKHSTLSAHSKNFSFF